MWNHSQKKGSRFGDAGSSETDPDAGRRDRDRIEKSLDLTQYLKYLDELFSQTTRTSESESSDNDDEGNRTFTQFLQPTAQTLERPRFQFNQGSGQLTSFSALKSSDSLHSETSISPSSSLCSVDSGTSSLSLNLTSTEFHPDVPLAKLDGGTSAENTSSSTSTKCLDNSSSAPGTDDDKLEEQGKKRAKKPQKKKKAGGDDNSRQNKPSSDGNGHGGSEGGGGSGGPSSSTGSSGGNFAGTNTGGSSSKQGSVSASPGAKNRTGAQHSQQCEPLNFLKAPTSLIPSDDPAQDCLRDSTEYDQTSLDINDGQLDSIMSESDDLLLDGDLTENFTSDFLMERASDIFDSNPMNSFPLTTILDMSEDENILNHFISMTAPPGNTPVSSSPKPSMSQSQSSTKASEKVASPAAATSTAIAEHNVNSSKVSEKKRKADSAIDKELPNKVGKLSDKQKQSKIEYFNAKRKKIYVFICRKEIGKTQRSMANTFKESLTMKKKLAQACERHQRKKAQQSEKCVKESICRAKKLTQEMQEMELYWKMADRAERDFLRTKEKEEEEIHKHESEMLCRKAKDIKFDRLTSLIELFATKLCNNQNKPSEEQQILSNLVYVTDEKLAKYINYDRENIRTNLEITTERALNEHHNLVKLLDASGTFPTDILPKTEIVQPCMFDGTLRGFQMKGINWIKRLYIRGLNGILADENGLGKKIQVVAFLSHLAKTGNVWGPFLIVSSSTSLCKWQQVFNRLTPRLKILSYSGKPAERNLIRRRGDANSVNQEDSDFHVVITSYQAMMSDLKHFNLVKWQYLVMDDSQDVITTSTKWISLLSFRCRNKLLLSHCPKLNSSSNLCSYLYFIMPSLFDSHEELSEWFLQELESTSAKYNIDETTLMRLRVVVQKFLLRRTKSEVNSEKTDKMEVQFFCPLSMRQQRVYSNLLKDTNVCQILDTMNECNIGERRKRLQTLLNLSSRLLKTCNHPDLVRKRYEEDLPLWMQSETLVVPQLIFSNGPKTNNYPSDNSSTNILRRLFCIYNSYEIYKSLFDDRSANNAQKYVTTHSSSSWSFIRFVELSFSEAEEIFRQPDFSRLNHLVNFRSLLERLIFESAWKNYGCKRAYFMQYPSSRLAYLFKNQIMENLLFTSFSSLMYTWKNCEICMTPNEIEYRTLQSKNLVPSLEGGRKGLESRNVARNTYNRSFQQLEMPKILLCYFPKITSVGFQPKFSNVTFSKDKSLQSDLVPYHGTSMKFGDTDYTMWMNQLKNVIPSTSPRAVLLEQNQFVRDSGKLRRLDRLLSSLKESKSGVLLCSHYQDTLDLLEEFLTLRKLKHNRIREDIIDFDKDVFVFTMLVSTTIPDISVIPAKAVVLFDQDWTVSFDEKSKIIRKLVQPAQVTCYFLTCEGTIEERLSSFSKKASVVQNDPEFSPLKALVNALMCEYNYDTRKCNLNLHKHILSEAEDKIFFGAGLSIDNNFAITRDEDSGVFHEEKSALFEGSDSASTSGSREESDVGGKVCPEDNFVFSFDEGYMGMSPDSFDDTVKSDYEDDSSPAKWKVGRGSGKRGRPPSRVRLQRRDLCEGQARRGPGRPRLKQVGPPNQGGRGRKGRPPLTKKAETIAASLASIAAGQRVFGFYSSSDFEFS